MTLPDYTACNGVGCRALTDLTLKSLLLSTHYTQQEKWQAGEGSQVDKAGYRLSV